MNHQWIEKFIYKTYVHISNIVRKRCTIAVPATPANLVVDATASNLIEVSWDNVAGETGFNLYRSIDDATYILHAILPADEVSHDDWTVNPSAQYYYKISAFNGDGESALSTAQNDTTLAQSFKVVYLHQTGGFNYDANSRYRGYNSKRFMKAIYGGGKSWLSYLQVDTSLRVDIYYYLGEETTDGSWRWFILSNNLTFQRRESGVWVTKSMMFSSLTTRIISTDSPYTILTTDIVIFADTDGGVITANLTAGVGGKEYKIINCGSSGNNVTVDPNGTEQLYGAGAGVAYTLTDGNVITIHYNATEGWW